MPTALPSAAGAPPSGDWLMTVPAATVSLVALVTVTVNPAPVMAVVATACVEATTFGTVTITGPIETTSATVLPVGTTVGFVGLWLMTRPASTVALFATVDDANRLTPVIALIALACVAPTTFGTTAV